MDRCNFPTNPGSNKPVPNQFWVGKITTCIKICNLPLWKMQITELNERGSIYGWLREVEVEFNFYYFASLF